MIWLPVIAFIFAYSVPAAWIIPGIFAIKRPFIEPVACSWAGSFSAQYHSHSPYCYQRPDTMIETAWGAMFYALMCGAGWPVTVACSAVIRFCQWLSGWLTRPTEAERAAMAERLGHGK